MRGENVDLLFCFSFDPTAEDTAAWKRKHVRTIFIDDRKGDVPIKRCTGDVLPHMRGFFCNVAKEKTQPSPTPGWDFHASPRIRR